MNRIRTLREDKDLRQLDVAKATGIDQKTLSNYETGKTNPDSFAIIRLADFFNVSTDYLLGVSDYSIASPVQLIEKIDKIESELDEIKEFIQKTM